MNTRTDFLRQAERKYFDFLRAVLRGERFFPLFIVLGKSTRAATYDARREELLRLRSDADALGLTVDWRMVDDRRFGRHERPEQAYFADEATFLRALGKAGEAAAFRRACATILERHPDWHPWLEANVPMVLRELNHWERILEVVNWLRAHPSSGLYLRQLPIFGVDTKFIESRFTLLDTLLALPDLPAGDADFRSRWGLRAEEPMVRLRFLDPAVRARCGFPACAEEIALPLTQAATLPLDGGRVIMVENLRNFLALPPVAGGVAVFGSGDALAHWKRVPWLPSSACHYWGDLDVHGFAMLARLREFMPHAHSLLMDRATLEYHRPLAVTDDTRPPAFDRSRLHPHELEALDDVTDGRLRLEQERIPMEFVTRELQRLQHLQ